MSLSRIIAYYKLKNNANKRIGGQSQTKYMCLFTI